jgi:hypothetical protein
LDYLRQPTRGAPRDRFVRWEDTLCPVKSVSYEMVTLGHRLGGFCLCEFMWPGIGTSGRFVWGGEGGAGIFLVAVRH